MYEMGVKGIQRNCWKPGESGDRVVVFELSGGTALLWGKCRKDWKDSKQKEGREGRTTGGER